MMIGDLDPCVLLELELGRHGADLRRAEIDRAAKQLCRPGPSLRARATVAVAEGLIALGLRLKRRYAPRPESGHVYGPSVP